MQPIQPIQPIQAIHLIQPIKPIHPLQPVEHVQHVQFESWTCPLFSGSKIDGSHLEFVSCMDQRRAIVSFLVIDGMSLVFCRQASAGTGVRPTLTTVHHNHVETGVLVSIK